MKVEELRVGNFVSVARHESAVKIIHPQWVYIEGNLVNNSYDQVEPIPLTEKWLEGFGFENQDDEIDYSEFEFNGVIIHGQGHYQQSPFLFRHESLHITDRQIEIKYVHQLQNLYFALTGEDLTLRAAPPKPKCDHEWTFIGTVSDEHCHKCGEWGNID